MTAVAAPQKHKFAADETESSTTQSVYPIGILAVLSVLIIGR